MQHGLHGHTDAKTHSLKKSTVNNVLSAFYSFLATVELTLCYTKDVVQKGMYIVVLHAPRHLLNFQFH